MSFTSKVLVRIFRKQSVVLGHMTVDGTVIYDELGNPYVPKGFSWGHGELIQPGQITASAAMGATHARLNCRLWGDYGQGGQIDGQALGYPGNLKPTYLSMLDWQVEEAYAAGIKVQFGMDSDCGQGIGGTACTINGQVEDFWTPGGQAQLQAFIETSAFLAARYAGKVQFWEPLVEPLSLNADQAKTWDLQEQVMTAVQAANPNMLFVIGPYKAYGSNYISGCYKPSWASSVSPFNKKIILTANLLNDILMNETLRTDRINKINAVRAEKNVPVMVNQIGTNSAEDATDSIIDLSLSTLNTLNIGWDFWEHTSVFQGSFGMNYLANVNDLNSARVLKPNRYAVLNARM